MRAAFHGPATFTVSCAVTLLSCQTMAGDGRGLRRCRARAADGARLGRRAAACRPAAGWRASSAKRAPPPRAPRSKCSVDRWFRAAPALAGVDLSEPPLNRPELGESEKLHATLREHVVGQRRWQELSSNESTFYRYRRAAIGAFGERLWAEIVDRPVQSNRPLPEYVPLHRPPARGGDAAALAGRAGRDHRRRRRPGRLGQNGAAARRRRRLRGCRPIAGDPSQAAPVAGTARSRCRCSTRSCGSPAPTAAAWPRCSKRWRARSTIPACWRARSKTAARPCAICSADGRCCCWSTTSTAATRR